MATATAELISDEYQYVIGSYVGQKVNCDTVLRAGALLLSTGTAYMSGASRGGCSRRLREIGLPPRWM
jgi:hypothetical protein